VNKAAFQFAVFLPNGTCLRGTISTTPEVATAKAMRMDIPPGCELRRIPVDPEISATVSPR
jgi:hypothetical protein